MNLRLFLSLGILGACGLQVLAAQNATAQTAKPAASSLDLAVTYNAQSTNIDTTNRFWMQGGSAQLHVQFWRGLGVVADVAGTHTANMHNSGVGLDLVTATFGPRYTWQLPHNKFIVYGQFLAGEVWGLDPDRGKLRWRVETKLIGNICPSPVVDGDTLYVFGGVRSSGSYAIRAGGKGNVTASNTMRPPSIRIGAAPGASVIPIAWSWMATSSSMSLTERCRLLMCMPTSRK